ncbi:MAG: hypothetical protein K0S07_559 [Chlamydiales bacterium]|nr:hypothetical protein [Chlamydiales bacterium]
MKCTFLTFCCLLFIVIAERGLSNQADDLEGGAKERLERRLISLPEGKQRREFSIYRGEYLTLKIIDDGLGSELEDLFGVQQRLLLRWVYREKGAFRQVEHSASYLDRQAGEGGQEKLLQKQILTYDKANCLLKKEQFDNQGRWRHCWQFSYDERGNLLSESNPLGQITRFMYDEQNNLVHKEIDGSAFYTAYAYDKSNRLVLEEEVHEYFTKTTQYIRDQEGRILSTVDPYQRLTDYRYDKEGRLIEEMLPWVLKSDTTAERPVQRYRYDKLGQLVLKTDAKGAVTRYAYEGDKKRITYPNLVEELWEKGELKERSKGASLTRFTYDPLHRLIKKETWLDPISPFKKTTYHYDAFHLIEKKKEQSSCHYRFNAALCLVERLEVAAKGSDTRRTTYHYDTLNRRQETRHFFGSGPDDYIASFEIVDRLGRVIEKREEDAFGQINSKTCFVYDLLGNQTQTFFYTGADCPPLILETHYDSASLPILTLNFSKAETDIGYGHTKKDALGQLLLLKERLDPFHMRQQELYNGKGQLIELRLYNRQNKMLYARKFFYGC